jgi:hypothetical protein
MSGRHLRGNDPPPVAAPGGNAPRFSRGSSIVSPRCAVDRDHFRLGSSKAALATDGVASRLHELVPKSEPGTVSMDRVLRDGLPKARDLNAQGDEGRETFIGDSALIDDQLYLRRDTALIRALFRVGEWRVGDIVHDDGRPAK